MAYLHCHNHLCDFSQDDFWDFSFGKRGYKKILFWYWKYNPISCFLSYVFGQSNFSKHAYIIPRRIEFDKGCMEDHGWKRIDPHSWWLICDCFKSMIRKFKAQEYWTYNSWRKAVEKNGGQWPCCPICGKKELDID